MSKVMDLQLPSKQKFVLLCIANNADDYETAFPSITSLSRDTCIPERTIQRLVAWLVDNKYIECYWDYAKNDHLRRRQIRFFRLILDGKTRTIRPDYSNCPTPLRREVIKRFNQVCSYCRERGTDKSGPDGKAWEIDRIIPGSRGGGYVANNVTLSCGPCNRSKGAKVAPPDSPEMAPFYGAKITDLGAILDPQGCQNEQTVVPAVAHYPKEEPSIDPSLDPPYDGSEFLSALDAYDRTAKKRKVKESPEQRRVLFKKLARWGEEMATSALEDAVANSWRGVFEPTRGNGNAANKSGNGYQTANERRAASFNGLLSVVQELRDESERATSEDVRRKSLAS